MARNPKNPKNSEESVIFSSLEGMKAAGMRPGDIDCVAQPDIQDALKNPRKWNAHWERALSMESNGGIDFSPRVWYNSEVQEHKMMTKQHPHLLDALYHDYPSLSRNTLQLQIGIIQDVCSFRDFDAKWLAADPSVREEHVLSALSRICSTANNLHDARKLCATELNLAYLAKDGRHLIGLLKAVVPQDLSKPPSSLSYFSHPDWDSLHIFHEKSSPSDLEKLVYQRMLVLRTKLICHVINTIFRSFLGLGVNNIVVSRGHTVRQELERNLGIKNKLAPGAQKGRQGCDSKACPNGFHQWIDIPKDKVFLRCKECWEKQHREVKYCSKDCQRVDWKSGHKAVCGKPLDFDTVAEIATSNQTLVSTSLPKFVSAVGPAKPGFKMSISLQVHLIQLSVNPNTDYMLLPTTLAPPENGFDDGRTGGCRHHGACSVLVGLAQRLHWAHNY
ncbi:hypothetical protein C8R47DRAFT_11527 [Mycena vitilis]|nr:hypothetical protein C8R47DRAFT_11527 [Mycena vitilis]